MFQLYKLNYGLSTTSPLDFAVFRNYNVITDEARKEKEVTKMERKIVRIGNSYGIVLPQAVLKLAGLRERHKLKLKIEKNKLILTPIDP